MEESEAIEGSYGAGPDSVEEKFRDPHTFFPRDADSASLRASGIGENTSAYMLVYVRECDLPKTMMLDANGDTDNVGGWLGVGERGRVLWTEILGDFTKVIGVTIHCLVAIVVLAITLCERRFGNGVGLELKKTQRASSYARTGLWCGRMHEFLTYIMSRDERRAADPVFV